MFCRVAKVAEKWGVDRRTALKRLEAMDLDLGGKLLLRVKPVRANQMPRRRHVRVNVSVLARIDRSFGASSDVAMRAVSAVNTKTIGLKNELDELREIVERKLG